MWPTTAATPTNLRLAGQENNGTTWSISKMNMLLHGIRDADLRNNDTLAGPEHVSADVDFWGSCEQHKSINP